MQYKIAFVGEKDIVYPFGMLGLESFYTHDEQETRRVVNQLVEENFGVIFITEEAYKHIPDIIERYASQYMPAFIPIPSDFDEESIGLARLDETVKTATGQKLF
ncbi:V-type ATP synthase subunit F [Suicoccus acidiformans]|uniref:V-type ATP synthase subunit F n=1 Tax=Suicoccus acidiformans TaxID=2036206 RepID=A0A347WIX4_9LACT|nr:V-type ATP synthase subunit F [Suicoccus acidiformans]AXY25031.1 V-type ATP synthase subunit F [Suicoccus acidiformans]